MIESEAGEKGTLLLWKTNDSLGFLYLVLPIHCLAPLLLVINTNVRIVSSAAMELDLVNSMDLANPEQFELLFWSLTADDGWNQSDSG